MSEVTFLTNNDNKESKENSNKKNLQERLKRIDQTSLSDKTVKKLVIGLFTIIYSLFGAIYIRTYKEEIERIFNNEGFISVIKSKAYLNSQRDIIVIFTGYGFLYATLNKIMSIKEENRE